MSRSIFVDIGGHFGQSVAVALDGAWRFDEVHTFEPHPDYARHISERFADAVRNGRLTVHQVAVGDHDGELQLFGDNAKGGATILPGALSSDDIRVLVRSVDINSFLGGFGADDRIYVKLNCEGGEVAILDRMSAFSGLATLAGIVADFDISKSGFGYYEKRRVMRAIAKAGMPVMLAEAAMVGKTHAERLTNWLKYYPEISAGDAKQVPNRQRLKRRLKYMLRDVRSAIGFSGKGHRRRA
ncbi:MAG: FkbM family methyltransferase [Hyphomicrobiaceae bacterium]|nr:FkbM family methyltransferase [Hyphomicrobiaceae bacterium]